MSFEIKCDTTQKNIWKELRKDGITNEKELDEALKKIVLINIGCFVNSLQNIERK